MKTLALLFALVLVSAEAEAGMLYTYRTPAGERLITNHALREQEIRATGVILQEVRYTPDVVPPRVDRDFPLMRAGADPGSAASSPEPPRTLYTSQPLYQPVSIPPVAIPAPVAVPAVSVSPVSPQRFTIEPLVIPSITLPPAPSIPAVSIPPVTIPTVSIPPVSVPPPVTP